MDAALDLQPQHKLGQYTILRKLAEGGMAEIYLASRGGASGFSKSCVIKRVKALYRSDEKFRAMFELEAKLAANLEHSNIVQIFDFQSADDGELYLAMQYVDGCSLEQLRRRLPGYQMPPFLAARIARDVASALAYAYACPGPDGRPLGLVHRDISPHNILISRQGEVKLTDFGIAKPVSQNTSGGFKGKIAYMAPEQARNTPVDARTDIFALGVVLYELCTGSRPFDAPSDIALIVEMSSGFSAARRPSELGVQVPADLEDILDRALRRQPELRFQSAEELWRALEQLLRQAPSDVDVDLARFVAERLGQNTPEPGSVPQLQTGAFDDTRLSAQRPKVRQPTAHLQAMDGVVPAGATDQTFMSAAPLAAPPPPQRPASAAQPAPENPTFKDLPRFPEEEEPAQAKPSRPKTAAPATAPRPAPAVDEAPPELDIPPPLLSRSMKLGIALAAPAILAVSAWGAFRMSQKSAPAPESVVVQVPAPKPAPQPEPTQVATQPAPEQPRPQPVPEVKPPEPKPQPVVEAKPAEAEKPPEAEKPLPTVAAHVQHASFAGARTGTVFLNAAPYAQVFEGSRKLSEDGSGKVALAAGKHRLKFVYADQTASYKVEVPPDGKVCVRADFTGEHPAISAAACAGN